MRTSNKILTLLALILIFMPSANANIIFPHLMLINIYSIFIFAIPIIFTETFYYIKNYKNISVLFWILSTIAVNTVSSIFGIFIGGVSSFLIPNFVEYSNNFILIFIQFTICCILSWLIEYILLFPILKIFKRQTENLFKSVFFANLFSYIVIFVLYSIIFYIPQTHKIFFYGF